MQLPATSTLVVALLVPLVAWRVVVRFRRLIGRQRASKYRIAIHLVLFPALAVLLAFATRTHPERLAWLAGGLLAGGALSVYGLKQTTFEPTRQGLFYTPNAHLGFALSMLFLLRIAYRFVEVFLLEPQVEHGVRDFARSPLTLAIFGLLAGYITGYAVGLARWRHRVLAAKRLRERQAAASGAPDASPGPTPPLEPGPPQDPGAPPGRA
jgi:hypothetical protein